MRSIQFSDKSGVKKPARGRKGKNEADEDQDLTSDQKSPIQSLTSNKGREMNIVKKEKKAARVLVYRK